MTGDTSGGSKFKLILVITIVGVGIALTGCIEEDDPDDDIDDVDVGDVNGAGDGNGEETDPGGESDALHLKYSNETVDIDGDLKQSPPDAEEAGLSLECQDELAGYSWEGTPDVSSRGEPLNPRHLEVMIHDTVNSIRTAQGNMSLYCDEDLRRIAIDHAESMKEHDYVGSTDIENGSINHEGLDPLERMWLNDYQCDDAGENHMAFIYDREVDSAENLKGMFAAPEDSSPVSGQISWTHDSLRINSPQSATNHVVNQGWFQEQDDADLSTRDIMLSGNYTRQGVGAYYDYDNNTVYTVQKLC